jgi:hypothetical protein
MKIEETYRDLKSLLGLTKLMNKQQVYMEKMVSLLFLTFTIGLLVGEELRDLLYGELIPEEEQVNDQERIPGSPSLKKGKKWKRYSGLFVLLKQKWTLSELRKLLFCRPLLLPFVAWFIPMSDLLSEPQVSLFSESVTEIGQRKCHLVF